MEEEECRRKEEDLVRVLWETKGQWPSDAGPSCFLLLEAAGLV